MTANLRRTRCRLHRPSNIPPNRIRYEKTTDRPFHCRFLCLVTARASEQTAPHSVVHVVTVEWKKGTTPEQIKAALDGAQALPESYKGITHVWTKTLKVQGGKNNVIVMEFTDEAAFKAYTDSDAQKEWYK